MRTVSVCVCYILTAGASNDVPKMVCHILGGEGSTTTGVEQSVACELLAGSSVQQHRRTLCVCVCVCVCVRVCVCKIPVCNMMSMMWQTKD